MNLWDVHMHSHNSGDSQAAIDDMIQAAISRNLKGICFTDHYDLDYPGEPEMFLLDFDAYYKEVSAYKEKYKHTIPIRFGIELGLQSHIIEQNNKVVRSYPFDFVIGSSHVCNGADPYYPSFYEGRTEAEAYLEYFESILENAKSDVDFDVYGHIDYVVRYGPNQNKNYTYQKYSDILDEILKTLIYRGKGIEVNTGGFAKGLGHPNPTEDIIKRYKELGGEIITTGADAHKPEMVGYEFERLEKILQNVGFKFYTVFTNRKPEFVRI